MTDSELGTLVRALGPVMREYVTKALAELTPRLAAAEATIAILGDVRDRVVAVETKAAIPPAPDASLGELRDRLLVLETKAAAPAPEPLAVIQPAPIDTKELSDLRDRLLVLETRTPTKALWDELSTARLQSLEHQAKHDDAISREVTTIRERIAVLEVRAQVPGPPGKDGKDGADGLGFDDLAVEFDGDRTLMLKFERGTLKKSFPITLPYLRYQGVFIEGKLYAEGDVVTWAGSTWNANEDTTTKPGEGSKAWTLCVKRGRDGKDGRDAASALPVVSVGRPVS